MSKVFLISNYHLRKLQLLLAFVLILAALLLIINLLYYEEDRARTQFQWARIQLCTTSLLFFVGRLYHYSEI